MEKKNLITAEYATYKFEDLEVEEQAMNRKANNTNLSPAVRRDALERLEVIEVAKVIFSEVLKKGVSPLGMRFDQAFFIVTGQAMGDMKTSALGNLGAGFVRSTDKIADKAIDVTRNGLNKFATWLSNKTTK